MKKLAVVLAFIITTLSSIGQTFYDQGTIQKIEITFLQPNWDFQLDTSKAGADGYIMASQIKINGTILDSVAVKYKGNSSYSPSFNKNPLSIELNHYKNQSYQGYTDIKLGNNYADPSMIREVLGYDILKNYMHCPKSNFAKVYINGAYFGVYSNTENINKKFYSDHFNSSGNTAVKCNPTVTPSSNTKSNMKFINNDSTSYFAFYELKSNKGWNEFMRLCDTVTNYGSSLENTLDIDRAIWMLAFNSAIVNLDSYTGAFCQNYYLYKDNNKRFNPIIWDLNMCIGGFPHAGSGTVSLGSQSIPSLQQLPLNIHSTDVHWPLINKIQSDARWKKMYAAHVKTIMNEMISSGTYTLKAGQFQTLIDTSVQSDPFKFYTHTQFQNSMNTNISVGSYSVPGINTFMTGRNTYLQAQPEFTLTAPTLSNILSTPATPSINDTIWVKATINNVNYCYLGYRNSTSLRFTKVQMYDDGAHHDGAAGDGVFGQKMIATSPTMQYYIYAENANCGKFAPERAEHEFYSINVAVPTVNKGDMYLNEFMAKNETTVADNNGQYEDWLEIFNNTGYNMNLGNVYLSNSLSNLKKWRFPSNAIINTSNVLAVWMDEDTTQTGYHANFKLPASGGSIFLSNASGVILDSITFGPQSADIAMRKCPDGIGSWSYSMTATFNLLNCNVGLEELKADDIQSNVFPVPADEFVMIESQQPIEKIEITDISGKIVFTDRSGNYQSLIVPTKDFSPGIYFIRINSSKTHKFVITH